MASGGSRRRGTALVAALGLTIGLAIGLWLDAGPADARAAELAVGDAAPDFTLVGSDGKLHSLSTYRGKTGVVLAWFPKAFTPGCTAELGSLHESVPALAEFDLVPFMVSVDSAAKNAEFAEVLGAGLTVLSDPGGETARRYGVLGLTRTVARRWTFVIDREGRIVHIEKEVDAQNAGAQLVRILEAIDFPRRRPS